MEILVTGFEPFGGSPINSSEQVVRALDGQTIGGAKLLTAVLPVDNQRGPQALLEVVREQRPGAVLCLGQAARRPAVSIERVAINLLDFRIPDNTGHLAVDEPVVPGGPAAYFVTLPVRSIYQTLVDTGIPTELSLSAGTYLCNQVLYHLLHVTSGNIPEYPAGFIHLPLLPQQAVRQSSPLPSMSLETMLAGIQAAIAVIVSRI